LPRQSGWGVEIIALLPAVNESAADVEDQMIIRAEEVKTVVKR
jgi:hypothetical protein